MPTLKEIKGRIASVKSTLKITSAMKLVSSAKLRKAQKAIEAMRPYEAQLQRMLSVVGGPATSGANAGVFAPDQVEMGLPGANPGSVAPGPTAIVAIASNSSLCGGFNANVIAKLRSVRRPGDVVYSVGRKMADAMRKDGFASPADFTALADHPSYGAAASLVDQLVEDLAAGRIAQVLLVYNHFVSTAKQVPTVEVLMASNENRPAAEELIVGNENRPTAEGIYFSQGFAKNQIPSAIANPTHGGGPGHSERGEESVDAIIEPGKKELVEILEPKVLKLKLYAALLDSSAAEHAARTVAMQTATDNGENLLSELTLQYNKGRQQKITAEILDLAGGQAQD